MKPSSAWVDAAWQLLSEQLRVFGAAIQDAVPLVRWSIHRTDNDAFPLRGFLTMTIGDSGDELAVVIDLQGSVERISITSDLVWDDGTIVGHGPAMAETTGGEALEHWLPEFRQFLSHALPLAIREIRHRG